jgi:hypothetical protein
MLNSSLCSSAMSACYHCAARAASKQLETAMQVPHSCLKRNYPLFCLSSRVSEVHLLTHRHTVTRLHYISNKHLTLYNML